MIPIPPLVANFVKANVLKIIAVVAIALVVGFAYYQYRANITLRAENYNLQATVYETQVKMDLIKLKSDQITELNRQMLEKERDLNQAIFDLNHKFTKKGRDFKNLARQKPGLVDNIINNAIRQQKECFEQITMGNECLQK